MKIAFRKGTQLISFCFVLLFKSWICDLEKSWILKATLLSAISVSFLFSRIVTYFVFKAAVWYTRDLEAMKGMKSMYLCCFPENAVKSAKRQRGEHPNLKNSNPASLSTWGGPGNYTLPQHKKRPLLWIWGNNTKWKVSFARMWRREESEREVVPYTWKFFFHSTEKVGAR